MIKRLLSRFFLIVCFFAFVYKLEFQRVKQKLLFEIITIKTAVSSFIATSLELNTKKAQIVHSRFNYVPKKARTFLHWLTRKMLTYLIQLR